MGNEEGSQTFLKFLLQMNGDITSKQSKISERLSTVRKETSDLKW